MSLQDLHDKFTTAGTVIAFGQSFVEDAGGSVGEIVDLISDEAGSVLTLSDVGVGALAPNDDGQETFAVTGTAGILGQVNVTLTFTFTQGEAGILSGVAATFSATAELNIPNFPLRSLSLSLAQTEADGGLSLAGELAGTLTFDDKTLNLSVQFPAAEGGWYISGTFEGVRIPGPADLAEFLGMSDDTGAADTGFMPDGLFDEGDDEGIFLSALGLVYDPQESAARQIKSANVTLTSGEWAISEDFALHSLELNAAVEMPLVSAERTYSVEIDGALRIGEVEIAARVARDGGTGEWLFGLNTMNTFEIPSLADVVRTFGGSAADNLPAIFDPQLAIGLSMAEVIIDPAASSKVREARLGIYGDWEVVPGVIALHETRFALQITRNAADDGYDFDAQFNTTIVLGEYGDEDAFYLPVAIARVAGSDEEWLLTADYGDTPQALPTLADLIEAFGGDVGSLTFLEAELALKFIEVQFNPTARTIPRFQMTVTLDAELIPNVLLIGDAEVDLHVANPTDPAMRSYVDTTIKGTTTIVGLDIPVDGVVTEDEGIKFTLPDLQLFDLAEELLGALSLPADLPDLTLAGALNFSFEQGTFSYEGASTLPIGESFALMGVTVRPPDAAQFVVKLERYKETDEAGVVHSYTDFSLSIVMQQGQQLALESSFAWTRELGGMLGGGDSLRELQNDDEAAADLPPFLSFAIVAEEDFTLTIIQTTLGLAGSTRFFVFEDSPDDDDSAISLGYELGLLGEALIEGSLEIPAEEPAPALPPGNGSAPGGGGSSGGNGSGSNGNGTLPAPGRSESGGRADAPPTRTPQRARQRRSLAVTSRQPKSGAPRTPDKNRELALPFLKRGKKHNVGTGTSDGQGGGLGQRIKVYMPGFDNISFEDGVLGIDIPIGIFIGPMELESELPVRFDLGKMALSVDHPDGIKVMSKQENLLVNEDGSKKNNKLFGLSWDFLGAQQADGRYHHLTLVTKDFDYQVKQAEGARIEISYTQASKEPITFIVSEFALGGKGLTLTAAVADTPVTLNGLDTKFRFGGSELRIVENRIQGFTLAGSGPLPPALVGDAMADVALQFEEVQGALKLIAGSAKLQKDKLLDCKGTRFQFQIDAIGLQFVNDDKFHLFFTLTGKAQLKMQKQDNRNGALAWMPNIQIELHDCPLTGDASVIAKHISFLVELPKPISFPLFGAYEFEVRAIGFVPQFDKFNNDGAMRISGQIKFAQGKGDANSGQVDLHNLYIGLPEKGKIIPRLYMDRLPLDIAIGDAFKLSGSLDFYDTRTKQGFDGEGVVEIKGLPPVAASFAFLRVRENENAEWKRAWFIYLEVRQISFRIPVVEMYIREVGLGFGYRYTLVGIKKADEANDLQQLLKELKVISRTQGDLSKRDRWAIDVEKPGESVRWTIVLRAMIAQMSAAILPLDWKPPQEEALACVYLFDAVIAFRSDITFFMNVRGWINTSYGMYVKARNEGKELAPFVSGFVFLWPLRKRFLAHLASNPDGHLGSKPEVPPFVETALRGVQFSATLLIEPNLFHFELGWPNMLRWTMDLGPMKVDYRGGFIFRVSSTELVLGVSFLARASLTIDVGIDLGLVGASLHAYASLAYGGRFIGLIDFVEDTPYVYAGIGFELRIGVTISLWIKIPLLFVTLKLEFSFSLHLAFTASLEVGLNGDDFGLRGQGTVSVSLMGHGLEFSVTIDANGGAVQAALDKTTPYLHIGLEAGDDVAEMEAVPGTLAAGAGGGASRIIDMPRPRGTLGQGGGAAGTAPATVGTATAEPFGVPDYTVFVIRDTGDGHSYFVLLPRAEADGGTPGFLPVPPDDSLLDDASLRDFRLELPDAVAGLRQFDPASGTWADAASSTLEWRANWAQQIIQTPQEDYAQTGAPQGASTYDGRTLLGYLRLAYLMNPDAAGRVEPLRDPDPLPAQVRTIADERVHNPSDSAFEAAVRGAVEQFQGSPYFKRDPNYAYDRVLEAAFKDDTTIYSADGSVQAPDATGLSGDQANQQARQLRSLVINGLIDDLQSYVDLVDSGASDEALNAFAASSIAFQLGLVFSVEDSAARPAWLDSNATSAPTIRQRNDPAQASALGQGRTLRTFNTLQTDFATNPPQFQRVQHYTSADTIAIAWDLVQPPLDAAEALTAAQRDPEHHLKHYQVRRRALDSDAPEVTYTVKGGAILHRESDDQGGSVINRLLPRFQVVDHFTDETLEDAAALPASGRSYLYTVTPVDVAGHFGHPLTLVATRYPSEPPQVPVDGELRVQYTLRDDNVVLKDVADGTDPTPQVVPPAHIEVTWSEPPAPREGPRVAVDDYYLVFRRDDTLPVGSYGLDGATGRPRTKLLPTSSARPLPTDIKVLLRPIGPRRARKAVIELAELQDAGVFPRLEDGGLWHSESWRVYFQAVSTNGVPSALAPVQVILRAGSEATQHSTDAEERRPAELEWLPQPVKLPLLPPEDQRAIVGRAHFPMPDSFTFDGDSSEVSYRQHPEGIRSIRLRWNQGASNVPGYPLELTAGYDLLQLDIDAHSSATFDSDAGLAAALRQIQEVRMFPADELLLVPGDTTTTSQWEAWYPSDITRRNLLAEQPAAERVEGSQATLSPWYSWRDSLLEWPTWPGLTDGSHRRTQSHHPFLRALVTALRDGVVLRLAATPEDDDALKALLEGAHFPVEGAALDVRSAGSGAWAITVGDRVYTARQEEAEIVVYAPTHMVDVQAIPPMQPGSLADFLGLTAPGSDPYGWGALARLGLSLTISLTDPATGEVVAGQAMLAALRDALRFVSAQPGNSDYRKHLHVELLFQPGKSVSLEQGAVTADALLGIVQVSLRPVIKQAMHYHRLVLGGPANGNVHLKFTFQQPFSLINQADPASGQLEFEPETPGTDSEVKRTFTLPLNGVTSLLFRAAQLPAVDFDNGEGGEHDPKRLDNAAITQTAAFFTPTNNFASYFTVSTEKLAAAFATAGDDQTHWLRFKRYVEALNSPDPAAASPGASDKALPNLSITVPTDAAALEALLPDFLPWAQRFFDHAPLVESSADTLAVTGDGPWLATAYPRVSTPAFATPDAGGRLQYDHLLEDKWAHTYRYYVRPYDRYGLLWRSFLESATLFPREEGVPFSDARLAESTPDHNAGGLDVVLDREHPLAKPVILNSARLDPVTEPGGPPVAVPPGKTWEVIVAQHPEQALIERNQTLARQLAFRQVAFTLLRRFAYEDWRVALQALVTRRIGGEHTITLKYVADAYPDTLPDAYPNTATGVTGPPQIAEDPLALNLPQRMASFAQAALVLHWRSLPFYYQHRLLLVAQTTQVVSPVNETTQSNFEYRTPDPAAQITRILVAANQRQTPPFVGADENVRLTQRTRLLRLPLKTLWDSLPDDAQAQWSAEQPSSDDGAARKPGSLPDPEMMYQLVEMFSGNMEIQAEVFYDAAEAVQDFARRQLGKHFLAEILTIVPPSTADPQADYALELALRQITEQPLVRRYGERALPAEVQQRIAFEGTRMLFDGVFSRRAYYALLLGNVAEFALLDAFPGLAASFAQMDAFLADWYSVRIVASTPTIPAEFVAGENTGSLEYRSIAGHTLVSLTVPLDNAGRAALRQPLLEFASTTDRNLRPQLEALTLPSDAGIRVAKVAFLGEADRGSLSDHLAFVEDAPEMSWRGGLTPEDSTTLRELVGDKAHGALLDFLQDQTLIEPYVTTGLTTLDRPGAPQVTRDKFTLTAEPVAGWRLRWTFDIDADEVNALHEQTTQVNAQPFTDAIAAMIRTILRAMDGNVNFLRRRLNQANEFERAFWLQSLNAAIARYDAASAAYNAHFDPDVAADPNAPDVEDPSNISYEDVIWWRVGVDDVQAALGDSVGHLSIAAESDGNLTWRDASGFDPDALEAAINQALNANIAPQKAFMDAFKKLMDHVRALVFPADGSDFDYRPTQEERPAALQNTLIVRGQLLYLGRPLNKAERDTLSGLFSAQVDQDAAQRLLDDWQDRETLDRLYRSTWSRVPVAVEAVGPVGGLDDRAAVETLDGEYLLLWSSGAMSAEDEAALKGLAADRRYRLAAGRLADAVSLEEGEARFAWSEVIPLAAGESPPAIPEALAGRLHIRQQMLAYHGLMTTEDAELLLGLAGDDDLNRRAVGKLYQLAMFSGLNGRELKIMARRGSASPSPMIDLTAAPLVES